MKAMHKHIVDLHLARIAAKNRLPTRFPKVTTREVVSYLITLARNEICLPIIQLTGTPHHGMAPLMAAIGKIYGGSRLKSFKIGEQLTIKLLVNNSSPCSTIL